MPAWNRTVKAWSLSALKQYLKCPAQYAYQRFDKLPEPPSIALENGIKVHSLGEGYLKGEIPGVPAEYRHFAKQMKAIKRLKFIAEDDWAITKDWAATVWDDWNNVWCRAKTDAHKYSKKTKHLDIIDFKTGKIYDDHNEGAEVYSMLGTTRYPDAETFNVEFWYLDRGEGEVGNSPFEYGRDEVEEFRDKWTRKAHRLMRAKEFGPKPGYYCRWCNFSSAKTLADGTAGPCDAWRRESDNWKKN